MAFEGVDDAELNAGVSLPAVDLLAPCGNEVWKGGDIHIVEWNATGDLADNPINIYYSIDNGKAWTLIGYREINDGSFSWRLPYISSVECLVKVSAINSEGNEIYDASASVFIIDSEVPSVQLESPDGGEIFMGKTLRYINWTAGDNTGIQTDGIDIYYSANGGLDWVSIAENEPDDGTHTWLVPKVDSETCLVKVDVIDNAGNYNYDTSDGFFTIESISPTVTITSQEQFKAGSLYEITWVTYDNFELEKNPVSIFYSLDGGQTWITIAKGEANDGSYIWNLPDDHDCIIRVEVTDSAGNVGADVSSQLTISTTEELMFFNTLATQLAIIPSSFTMTAGTQDTITIQSQNGTGTPEAVGTDTNIQLSTTSAIGEFRLVGTTTPVILVTIPAMSDSVQVDYYDEDAATYTLSANSTGFSDGTSTVTVEPGDVDSIIVTPDPVSVVVGTQQLFTAEVYDQFNNLITGETIIWSTDLGVINFAGILTARSTPGSGYVSATVGSVTGSADVTLIPSDVHHIVMNPTPVTLEVGTTQAFTATAYDIYNNEITGATFTWATDVGNVDASGFFTARTTPGTGTVTATNGSVSGLANVQVLVGVIDYITIIPTPVTITVGDTLQLTARAFDQHGNEISDVPFTWGTDVGSVSAIGFFTAQITPGVGTVTASNGTITGNAPVQVVAGPVHHIDLVPNVLTLTVGDTQQFVATAYDEFNNIIPGMDFTWTTDVGTIDNTGFFTAQFTPGFGEVQAVNGSVTGTADVTVGIGGMDYIVVTPDPVTITVGDTLQFTAAAYDAFDNPILGVDFDWTTDVGAIDSDGLLTAQTTPTTGMVTATNGTLSSDAIVTVNVGDVDHMTITPDPVTTIVGETQQFFALAYDKFNNLIPGAMLFWSTDVGVVNSTGYFTAQTIPGTGLVNVTSGSVTVSANVTVLVGPIDHIDITPVSMTIVVGAIQSFTANAFDAYNNSITGVTFTWATDVGAIDATGFYTAQTVPGIGTVTATNGT
ncbi:MAG: Ig-like domain-containing protein, partial [Thermoplasmata archaeon]|nr:Ig-like domain-containing protein [Thermoplasmata archaeon]